MPNRPERVPGWCSSLGCLGVTKQEPPRPGGGTRAEPQPRSSPRATSLGGDYPLRRPSPDGCRGCFLPCLGCAEDQGKGLPAGSRALGLSGGGGGRAHSSRQRHAAREERSGSGGWWPLPTGKTQPAVLGAQPRCCFSRRGQRADLKFRAAYLLRRSNQTEKNTGRERAGAFARVSCDGGGTRTALFPNLEIGLRGVSSLPLSGLWVRAVRGSLRASLPASSSVRGGKMQPGPIIM